MRDAWLSMKAWDESQVDRDDDGKFTSRGGGGISDDSPSGKFEGGRFVPATQPYTPPGSDEVIQVDAHFRTEQLDALNRAAANSGAVVVSTNIGHPALEPKHSPDDLRAETIGVGGGVNEAQFILRASSEQRARKIAASLKDKGTKTEVREQSGGRGWMIQATRRQCSTESDLADRRAWFDAKIGQIRA